jgi:hypothetical protein
MRMVLSLGPQRLAESLGRGLVSEKWPRLRKLAMSLGAGKASEGARKFPSVGGGARFENVNPAAQNAPIESTVIG